MCQEGAPAEGFDFSLSPKRRVPRVMIMEEDIVSVPREGQGKGFSKPIRGAGDES